MGRAGSGGMLRRLSTITPRGLAGRDESSQLIVFMHPATRHGVAEDAKRAFWRVASRAGERNVNAPQPTGGMGSMRTRLASPERPTPNVTQFVWSGHDKLAAG